MGVSVSRRYCAFGLGTLRRTQLDAELVADLSEQILCIIFRNNIRHEALAIASRFKMFLDMQPGGAYFSSVESRGRFSDSIRRNTGCIEKERVSDLPVDKQEEPAVQLALVKAS